MAEQQTSLIDLLSYDNPVLRNWCFWTAILIIKTVLMSLLTAVHRFRATRAKRGDAEGNGDDTMERVRRAHLNDLENILPYILISFVYTLANPMPPVAINLFRVVVGLRLWHTIVYAIVVIPQPARAIGFMIPLIITIYMAVQSAITFVN